MTERAIPTRKVVSLRRHRKFSYVQQLRNTADLFTSFANDQCKGRSPLYFQLCHELSGSPYLLQLAAQAKNGQPIPNLFLAAVHFLLLTRPEEELAQYYPSISESATSPTVKDIFLLSAVY